MFVTYVPEILTVTMKILVTFLPHQFDFRWHHFLLLKSFVQILVWFYRPVWHEITELPCGCVHCGRKLFRSSRRSRRYNSKFTVLGSGTAFCNVLNSIYVIHHELLKAVAKYCLAYLFFISFCYSDVWFSYITLCMCTILSRFIKLRHMILLATRDDSVLN